MHHVGEPQDARLRSSTERSCLLWLAWLIGMVHACRRTLTLLETCLPTANYTSTSLLASPCNRLPSA